MRKKKVWRYYCDFCKTSKGTPQSMRHHEERCTMNPHRKCGLCTLVDGGYGYLSEGLKALESYKHLAKGSMATCDHYLPKTAEEELRKATNDCPVCMYAALRQTGLDGQMPGFDFYGEKTDAYNSAMDAIREENTPW
jgi:hypothetical protein